MTSAEEIKGRYKKISALVDGWLQQHEGENFDLDLICRQLELTGREERADISDKLNYEVRHEKLKKLNRIYIYVNTKVTEIDWINAKEEDLLQIRWPGDHTYGTEFGFSSKVQIHPGETVVLAGVTNTGKTAFAMNFLAENMDTYPCTYFSSETTGAKFRERLLQMVWAKPTNGMGKPKFELVSRDSDWEDVIRPDNINIIDWVDVGDEFYKIGNVVKAIQSKLNHGMALICQQKNTRSEIGEGGERGMRLCSLYLTMDYNRINCKKCKAFTDWNPQGYSWSFQLYNKGTAFQEIELLEVCSTCKGKGFSQFGKCSKCKGSGYVTASPEEVSGG